MRSPAAAGQGGACVARAPVRADLAGGTLDLWPLGLLHPGGVTVAVALDLRVEVEARLPTKPGVLQLASLDLGLAIEIDASSDAPLDGRLELLERLARHGAGPGGIALTSRSPVRAGSGLGTSSALGVAAAAAIATLAGRRVRRDRLVGVVRDVEAQILGVPTGEQDHRAAIRGGVVLLAHRAGGPVATRLTGPPLAALSERLVVVDSGRSRSSGPSNWDMFRRRIEGDEAAVAALHDVARAGAAAAEAVESSDWPLLGRAMRSDLAARRRWSPLVVTDELERIFDAAREARALGYRVCGAGGGGFAVVLARDAGDRTRLERAIADAGGRIAETRPTSRGLVVRGISRPRP